ncbi:NUDIX domain-containing protein [Brevibacterium litoralis]|uniref:NUDIX domain-containing protein n=1 Tax=Brevibacterium litoralis TaxID=3138935 RepID=UPI003D9A6D58
MSGSPENPPENLGATPPRREDLRRLAGDEQVPGTGMTRDELVAHLRGKRRSGDGWVETPEGRFWGKFGAAGLLLHDPARGVLLQHRALWSAQGGTWGIPGGAIDAGETAVTGAIRECHEEAGVPELDGSGIEVLDTHVLEKTGWSYTTVVARATGHLEESINDVESLELRWVPLDEVTDYPLHPGFAASWPLLRTML